MSGYSCRILADSVNPDGDRLTTYEVVFPRMVLADITRHRACSFSVESTRAVPVETRIEMILGGGVYVPWFRKRAKGMGGGEEMGRFEQAIRRALWRVLGYGMAWSVKKFFLGVGKEHAGRLLEPFTWVTAIISATEWDNLFELRCPPEGEKPDPKYGAQIELQIIADMMRTARAKNVPKSLDWGQWHLPLVAEHERHNMLGPVPEYTLAQGSAGRCAAVSYLNHNKGMEGRESLASSVKRWSERLVPPKHWSPGEHPAQAAQGIHGNFYGFQQLRKFYDGESGRRARS